GAGLPATANQELIDSQFWYHAEFFEHERLHDLLNADQHAPDLVKVFGTVQNAALLCYYFFFPAHDEPVANKKWTNGTVEPCINPEAVQFNNFAGEWTCMAVLLERTDPKADFAPRFLGFSGRLTANASAAQADDWDNLDKGLVMTVV